MDRRLIAAIGIANVCAASIFIYNKVDAANKHAYITYTVPANTEVGNKMVYTDNTEGATGWKWDFGDGEYSIQKTGSHAYLDVGNYKVKLTVYGAFGALKDSGKLVSVVSTVPAPVPVAAAKVQLPVQPAPQAATVPHTDVKPVRKHHSGNGNMGPLPSASGAEEIK